MTEQQIDVEATMTEVVKSLGGESVDELLEGQANLPLNADYLFRTENVVAELKRLAKDLAEDQEYQARVQQLFEDFQREGLLKIYGTVKVNARDLPETCAHRWINILKPKVEEHVRKANRQIKSTKKHFEMPAAKGLLIVAHDGNYGLDPEPAMNLLSRCLKGPDHSHIDWVIYMTANMPVGLAGGDGDCRPIVTAPRYTPSDFPKDLADAIVDKWQELESTHLGASNTQFKGGTPDLLDHLKFRR